MNTPKSTLSGEPHPKISVIEDCPEIPCNALHAAPEKKLSFTDVVHCISLFFHEIYDFASFMLKAFPWLFVTLLLSPIYFEHEQLGQMFNEQGFTLIFSNLVHQWIGTSFQFSWIGSLILSCLRLMLGSLR